MAKLNEQLLKIVEDYRASGGVWLTTRDSAQSASDARWGSSV